MGDRDTDNDEEGQVPDVPGPNEPHKRTVSDLINECNQATDRMGDNNPHKRLIFNCAFALRQLVDRLDFYENPSRRM